jgi:hypothetical protein
VCSRLASLLPTPPSSPQLVTSAMGDADPFALPGMIMKRSVVNVDDVSSDEDYGTSAWIKSGQAKKEALREKERIKNLRQQSEGSKPSDGKQASDDDVEIIDMPSAGGHGRGGASSSGRASKRACLDAGASEPGSTSKEAEVLEEAQREKRAKQRAEKEKKRAKLFGDDDDDEAPGRGQRASVSSSSGLGRAAAAPLTKKLWLQVLCEGSDKALVSCVSDVPLRTGLLPQVAKRVAIDEARLVLRKVLGDEDNPMPGGVIDLSRTPQDLWNGEERPLVWAEEQEIKLLTLNLARGGSLPDVKMRVEPNAKFASLLTQYCEQHGQDHGKGKLTPAQVRLIFDGDALPPNGTPSENDLEDDDRIEVVVN